MFRNLEAEQARKGKTNLDMAELLGISRASYESKKRSGKLSVSQIFILCSFFDSVFEYLFATE